MTAGAMPEPAVLRRAEMRLRGDSNPLSRSQTLVRLLSGASRHPERALRAPAASEGGATINYSHAWIASSPTCCSDCVVPVP